MTGMETGAACTGGSDMSSRASATFPVSPTDTSSRSSIAGHALRDCRMGGKTTPRRFPGRIAAASNDVSEALTLS
eukprot:CAMPEP_0206245548 /NCGR_PEP_ID=MMETSP0047_2-20121206/18756_1 /ASSEMBLY_ACC=CAM_ASM_000192 /TAXON_ID=195065 /ORGANISM="Chroomonas mesostigmatica_cf, Strain CCMP1168" /LENGTH=74 /DNA_ID=CAMNT_0053670855 /DNA_START=273 /DNA_END=497 /DNA_ORIENTATION=+